MARVTVCDGCGEQTEDDDFYYINRYREDGSDQRGDLCPDCLPDSVIEDLNTED